MDSTDHISALIDQLDENLDNLQDALKSILNKSLTDVAAGYPMLDKAKFYILITYAIESAIFSFLRLTGTSAREHPVYRELERVKQYFQKAKLAEVTLQKPVMRLDQGAAGRFIKAALAGNDTTPVRQNGPSRTGGARDLEDSNNPDLEYSKKRKAVAIEDESNLPPANGQNVKDDSASTLESVATQHEKSAEVSIAPSTVATSGTLESGTTSTDTPNATESEAQKAERKRAARARKKERKRAAAAQAAQTTVADESTEASPPKKKQKKHKNKDSKDNP